MKQVIYIIAFFISALSFSQNTCSITGQVLDAEESNAPLMFAKVFIKENGAETLSDEKGNFKFENLAEDTYTLVFSFVGYETKAYETKITPNTVTNIKLSLGTSSISLEDFVATFTSADISDTSSR